MFVPAVSRLTFVSGGAAALSAAEAKTHARISTSAEDTLIGNYCLAAQRWIERETSLSLSTAVWRLTLPDFPHDDRIEIPRGPLVNVLSVAYVDTAGDAQTMDSGDLLAWTNRMPGHVQLSPDAAWPSTAPGSEITIDVTVGYATLPDLWQLALRVLVATWYQQREDYQSGQVDGFLRSIICSHKLRTRAEGYYRG